MSRLTGDEFSGELISTSTIPTTELPISSIKFTVALKAWPGATSQSFGS